MIEENNKLIALFMDAKDIGGATMAIDGTFAKLYEVCINPNANYKKVVKFYEKPTENQIHSIAALQYHASWDWLIPVVEKIEAIKDNYHGRFAVYISSNNCTIQSTMFRPDLPTPNPPHYFLDIQGENKIGATYEAITYFINWYNHENST